jgi:hypothetical protein
MMLHNMSCAVVGNVQLWGHLGAVDTRNLTMRLFRNQLLSMCFCSTLVLQTVRG